MSIENAKSFIQALNENPELAKLVNVEGADYVRIANDAGFDLTQEDLVACVRELEQKRKNIEGVEIDDKELDHVAGGFDPFFNTGHDEAPDGHDMGCMIAWHHRDWQKENNIDCTKLYYCWSNYTDCEYAY